MNIEQPQLVGVYFKPSTMASDSCIVVLGEWFNGNGPVIIESVIIDATIPLHQLDY